MKTTVAFNSIVDLAMILGVPALNERTDAWVCKVDDHWTFAVNGTGKEVSVDLGPDSMGIDKLADFHAAIWFNGWLAGIINPVDGTMCSGEAGNEDNFIKAVEERIDAERLAVELRQRAICPETVDKQNAPLIPKNRHE